MQIIKKFNNLYEEDECLQIENFFYSKHASWKLIGYSNNSLKRFWYHELMNYTFFSEDSANRIKNMIGIHAKLDRVYANGQSPGQDGEWHVDSKENEDITVLWYLQDFEKNWAGKTCFKESGDTYTPKRNTFIVFPSNIYHKGESPNEKFNGMGKLRISIAWKFSNLNIELK